MKGNKGKSRGNKVGLVACHVLGARETGATCHICNSKEFFDEFSPLSQPQKVTLGDGRTLEAIGTGAVEVRLKLPGAELRIGRLSEVLYVPTLGYNLLSVAKAKEHLVCRLKQSLYVRVEAISQMLELHTGRSSEEHGICSIY